MLSDQNQADQKRQNLSKMTNLEKWVLISILPIINTVK